MTCEDIARRYQATLIRINPREPEVPQRPHLAADGGLMTLCGRSMSEWVVVPNDCAGTPPLIAS